MGHSFATPDFVKPLDVARTIHDVPESATVRGMFFEMLNDRVKRDSGRALREKVPTGFSRGAMREYMQLLVEASNTLHPHVPLREGLRRIGHLLYDDFYATMAGKAIFAVAGRNFLRIAELAPRAYDVSLDPCVTRTRILDATHVRVTMAPNFVFPDTYQLGAWEGGARFCNLEPTIRVGTDARPGHVELDVALVPI